MKTPEHDDLANRSVGKGQGRQPDQAGDFEHQDISPSLLVKTIISMAVFVPLCLLLLWGLMSTVWRKPEPPPSPFEQPQVQTPAPLLQASPTRDYTAFHQQMDQHLNTFGWVDRDADLVHVPIAIAKQRLLEQGLPNRDQPPPPSRMPPGLTSSKQAASKQASSGQIGSGEPASQQVPLDPLAATQWLEKGPADAPVERQDLTPRDVLPPNTKKENMPIRTPQQPLEDSRLSDSQGSDSQPSSSQPLGSQRQEAP